ncbi:hypothetical protein [Flavobacterium sp. GSB-24]|uniref:hypothetical protein n=1 Tax=Flavobacterium sp. GSB-24 TaxID=2994319 RepID=UPI00249031E8|nr:hypothetical protein [Flavobacterium sp. GSB-24]BDU25096.1 hypothetical protein FLGSB24_18400 [Flavobacterium sp. GSB-24]
MDTNYNRIKVADLETNQPDKILSTNSSGELEFNDIDAIKIDSYNGLDYTEEGKVLDARQGKVLKDLINNFSSAVPYTVFIDTVNGIDSTGIIENRSKPFKTDEAAYAALPPNDGNAWNFVFLCNDVTRVLNTNTNSRRIKYICYNKGIIDFSSFNGFNHKEIYFDIPYGTLFHSTSITTGFSSSSVLNIYINANKFHTESTILFISKGAGSVNFYANEYYQRVSTYSLFRSGYFRIDKFDSISTTLVSATLSDLDIQINNLVLNNNFLLNHIGKFPVKKITGSGLLMVGGSDVIDVSKIITSENVTIVMSQSSVLTGKTNGLFLGKICLSPYSTTNIFNFYGKIEKSTPNYPIMNAGFQLTINAINSTIFLEESLIESSLDLNGGPYNFYFNNVEIIMITPSSLIKNVKNNQLVKYYKTGFIKSNGNLGLNGINIIIEDRTSNSY